MTNDQELTGTQYLSYLITELKAAALAHPLLTRFDSLTREQLRRFGLQFYQFVKAFPRYLGALLWTVPDERMRLALVANLVDECGGLERACSMDPSDTHPELFRRFTRALGITDGELDAAVPLTSTRHFLAEYERLTLHSPFLVAVGAFGPGNECIAEKWVPVLAGLRTRGEFGEQDLSFFAAHLPADEEHGNMLCAALLPYLNTPANRVLVREGAWAAVEARRTFWDGLT